MVHRNDHAAALERAAALDRELKRARTRADRADRRAAEAERRAGDAERRAQQRAAEPVPTGPRSPAPVACDYYGDRGGGVAFFWLLLILAVSIGAVVGALWLFARA